MQLYGILKSDLLMVVGCVGRESIDGVQQRCYQVRAIQL